MKGFRESFQTVSDERCKTQKKILMKSWILCLCCGEKEDAASEVWMCSGLRFPCSPSLLYLCIHQAPRLHCKSSGYRNGSSMRAAVRTVLRCLSARKCTSHIFINNVTVSRGWKKLRALMSYNYIIMWL